VNKGIRLGVMSIMQTYGVKPEGIYPIRNRMMMFGAAALLIVLASAGMLILSVTCSLRVWGLSPFLSSYSAGSASTAACAV
jgi:hypothetical protein